MGQLIKRTCAGEVTPARQQPHAGHAWSTDEQGLHTHEVEVQSFHAGAASQSLGLTNWQGLTSFSKLSAWSSARGKPSICGAAVELV